MEGKRSCIAAVDEARSIPDAFLAMAHFQHGREVYLQPETALVSRDPSAARIWHQTPYRSTLERISAVTSRLKALGVTAGTRVAILSGTRPEWIESDLAILAAGGVTVSIYPSLTAEEIGYILFDSEAQIVFAENEEQVAKLRKLAGAPCRIPATEERPAGEVQVKARHIIAFEAVAPAGDVDQFAAVAERDVPLLTREDEVVKNLNRESLASLVYTSGTTGAPKGVIQTHGNHLANLRQAYQAELFDSDTRLFLFLPLAHSFAKLMGYIGFLTDATLLFPAITDRKATKFDAHSITADIRESGAHLIPVVPRLLEKMQDAVLARSRSGGVLGCLVRTTIDSARRRFEARREGRGLPLRDAVLWRVTQPLRRRIRRDLFGDAFRYCVSGGAKLPLPVAEFFESLEIEVLEGYGLTETCVATNVNRLGRKKLGTVGPVLAPDIEIRLGDDGEIQFRGPNVSRGYWKRETATNAAWSGEGWFRTGDLGSIDADGFLSITGRKKEIIVTSGGKKIPPDPIEGRIKASPFVSQALLVGEGKNYCVALITLDREAIDKWARGRSLRLNSAELHREEIVRELVSEHMLRVNAELASFESVKQFAILAEDFTVENGLLTPTFKVKRSEAERRYRAEIEKLYAVER